MGCHRVRIRLRSPRRRVQCHGWSGCDDLGRDRGCRDVDHSPDHYRRSCSDHDAASTPDHDHDRVPAHARVVLLVGDSTLLAVEAYHALHALTGMDPVYEAKSCRLLAVPSCGKNPAPNSVEVIDTAEGVFDIVVIMAGYDEWYDTFAASFDQVVASSRAKGAKRIIWLSYPENVDYLLPDGTPGNDSLVNINQIMRDKLATGAFPDVMIADWFNYASLAEGYWTRDDIHLSPTGAYGVADYISRKVAFTASLPCPWPREPGAPVEVPCPDPDASGPVIDVVTLYDV